MLGVSDALATTTHPVGGRLIYLGLQPRDPLSPPDAPPTFDQREWPIDTLVRIEPTRTFFHIARAIGISVMSGPSDSLLVRSDELGAAASREPRLVLGYPAGAAAD